MLAGLKAVEAPEGFEGAVRTKIAEGRRDSSITRPTLWLAAKFALPLVLLLLLGGFLIVSSDGDVNVEMIQPVGESKTSVAQLDIAEPTSPAVATAANGSSLRNASVQSDRNSQTQVNQPQGGSQDLALSPDNTTVFPTDVDPRRSPITNSRPPMGAPISLASVLSMIGISSTCSSAGCLAMKVQEGSIAAIAGIQDGDLISAIDGRPINSGGISGQFSMSEITLIRAGKKMTFSIARR